jgi:hypothetical protein
LAVGFRTLIVLSPAPQEQLAASVPVVAAAAKTCTECGKKDTGAWFRCAKCARGFHVACLARGAPASGAACPCCDQAALAAALAEAHSQVLAKRAQATRALARMSRMEKNGISLANLVGAEQDEPRARRERRSVNYSDYCYDDNDE